MDRLIERCCGLDVHKTSIAACVRIPGPEGERVQHVRTFGTTTVQLLALRDWLEAHGVTHVAMESTGVYWKPVYYLLEDRFECLLVNAAHLKHVPGRKTDVQDCVWIAQVLEHGLLRGSFVPTWTFSTRASRPSTGGSTRCWPLSPRPWTGWTASRASVATPLKMWWPRSGWTWPSSPAMDIWRAGPVSVRARTRARASGAPAEPAKATAGCAAPSSTPPTPPAAQRIARSRHGTDASPAAARRKPLWQWLTLCSSPSTTCSLAGRPIRSWARTTTRVRIWTASAAAPFRPSRAKATASPSNASHEREPRPPGFFRATDSWGRYRRGPPRPSPMERSGRGLARY